MFAQNFAVYMKNMNSRAVLLKHMEVAQKVENDYTKMYIYL